MINNILLIRRNTQLQIRIQDSTDVQDILDAKLNLLIDAVLNKAPTQEIEEKARGELVKRGVKVIGIIPYDSQIAEACLEGKPLPKSNAKESVRKIVDELMRL